MDARTGPADWHDEPVRIDPYDSSWPSRFELEAVALRRVIAPWITGGVHHVGSTAVPGLAAKPIIDILVGVLDLESSRPCIDLVRKLDYHYAPYLAEEMHWFCKPAPHRRTHHLHLVPTGSARFVDELAFRDYLRAHPEEAREYEALKRTLADRYPNDREAYTEGKTGLVGQLTARANAWRQTPD